MSKKKQIQIDNSKGQVVLYKNRLEVRLVRDTVWLNLNQMTELFERDKSVISRHFHNIFKENELKRDSVVAKFATTASDRKIYQVEYFNLDAIIFVGYRINSKRGTQFRIWATNVLRGHLLDGYTINEKRLKTQSRKIKELQQAVQLLTNVKSLEGLSDEAKGIIRIIEEYSRALTILDDFDHQRLTVPKGTRKLKYKLTYEEAKKIIGQMRLLLKASSLAGQEKDQSLKSSIGALYQTFGKKDVYPKV